MVTLECDNTLRFQPATKSPAAGELALPGGLQVIFNLDRAAAVLALTTASSAPPEHYFLRQQAARLSLNPGFETLLSLNVVRNMEILDYQVATVQRVLQDLRGRALLCDEVGLGKTIEAGMIMMEYLLRGLARRVLVLTPPSLAEQWRTELQSKFNLDFVLYDDQEFLEQDRPWSAFDRVIASLSTVKREGRREQLLAEAFDLVIVDEAHHLKNRNTQAYRFVSHLQKKYILLLTATPVENDLEELFNLITLLAPGQLETAHSFKRKYVTRGDPLKPRNTTDLKQLLRQVMIRNRRSETGAIQAPRRAEMIRVDLTADEMTFYRRLTAFVRGYYPSGKPGPSGGINQFLLKTLQREVGSSMEAVLPTLTKIAQQESYPPGLRRVLATLATQGQQVQGRGKLLALRQLLQQLPEKAVIFTCFRETQRLLANTLRADGLTVAELHGQMRRQEKERQLQHFASAAQLLVATETGSEGRNMQFCRILINYDLPWNPMRIEQRIGRVHRLGQTREVLIFNFSAPETVEAYILELLDAKINMFQLVIGELEMILGNLREKQDFEDIILDIWGRASDSQGVQQEIDHLGAQLMVAKEHYNAVKALDDKLLGDMMSDD